MDSNGDKSQVKPMPEVIEMLRGIPFGELIETIEAAGLSTKNLLALFKSVKELSKE